MTAKVQQQAAIPAELHGVRLDQAVAKMFPDYSRSRLQGWIKEGVLTVDGQVFKGRDKVCEGALVTLDVELQEEVESWQAQDIPIDVVYEDDDLIVINKQAGLVVHPAAGNPDGTLLNALLHHCPELANLPRAGIVHRLDKDTTGLMVVAKTIPAHTHLVAQLQDRSISREYEAVVIGTMTGGGTVDEPIGRHPKQRQKMSVLEFDGKEAITHYWLIQRYENYSHIRVKLETGRTHQIRVHMAYLGYPLIGDSLYAGRFRIPKNTHPQLVDDLRGFSRQALHARRLGLIHPIDGDYCEWEVELADDFQTLLAQLEPTKI